MQVKAFGSVARIEASFSALHVEEIDLRRFEHAGYEVRLDRRHRAVVAIFENRAGFSGVVRIAVTQH
jgi:hypothetical protein